MIKHGLFALSGVAMFALAAASGLIYQPAIEDGRIVVVPKRDWLRPEPLPLRQPPDTTPTFPRCRGWGCVALHDSRALVMRVRQVTNTNDSGAGSLRNIVETVARSDTLDVVTFTTGGRICLESELDASTSADNLVIAGQTAPGGGITIACHQFRLGSQGAGVFPSDIVLSHLSLRKNIRNTFPIEGPVVFNYLGCAWNGSTGSGGSDCFNPGNGNHEEGLITFSNSLGFEPHAAHPTVMHFNARLGTVHSNLLIGPGRRFPWASSNPDSTGGIEIVNNVIYNWTTSPMAFPQTSVIDAEWNYMKRGPATNALGAFEQTPGHWRAVCVDGAETCISSVYWNNNLSQESAFQPMSADSAWRGSQPQYLCDEVTPTDWPATATCNADGDTVPLMWRRDVDLPTHLGTDARWPYVRQTMTQNRLDAILDAAGNSRGLTSDGRWISRRDSVDAAKVQEFRDGTGLVTEINFPGAVPLDPDTFPVVPVPAAGTPPTDTSGDGIPDEWLLRWGFLATDSIAGDTLAVNQAGDSTAVTGYRIIEHYLNNSDPFDHEPWYVTFDEGPRRVYDVPLIQIGFGPFTVLVPDTAVVPRGFSRAILPSPARDSALVVTCEAHGSEPADSVRVEDALEAWDISGVPSAGFLRTRPMPWAPC